MKLQVNKIFANSKKFSNSSVLWVMMVTLNIFLFSSNVFSQTTRPKPTPKKEIPVVVSRDSDSVRKTNNADANETTESQSNITVPSNNSKTTGKSIVDKSTKQKKMMLYLDLLTRTEQRAASLQKQLIDLIEKQNSLSTKIRQLEYQLRPEVIATSLRLTGSLRPEDLKEQRKKTLELEKSNNESLLKRLEARRNNMENSVLKADALVEKIRARFDIIIEEALNEDDDLL